MGDEIMMSNQSYDIFLCKIIKKIIGDEGLETDSA